MTSSDFRARAREVLAGKWGKAILVGFVASLLGALLAGSAFSLDFEINEDIQKYIPEVVITYLTIAASIGGILGTVQFIVGGVVQLGYSQFLLKEEDGQEGELNDLFSQFHRFADGFILHLLRSIFIALWTMLFIIPGIIAAYRYAMAPFILLENPSMKPKEAITASKEMMRGRKFELFCLDLSFIGWSILSALTMGIGYLWLNPYMNAAYAAFYRQLSPRAVEQVIPEMIEEQAESVEEL